VFDDETWNDSGVPRAVLILEIWIPHLRTAERELVNRVSGDVSEIHGTCS